jgi:hypothetical protein
MAIVTRRYSFVGPSNGSLGDFVGALAAQSAIFPVEVVDINIDDAIDGATDGLDEYMALIGWVFDPFAVPGGPLASEITPTSIDVGDTTVIGVGDEAARADHQHALPAPAAPQNVTKAAASAGASTKVAREDHKHDVTTAVVVSTGTANAEGVATSLSRSDHVHRTGLEVDDEGVSVGARPKINFIGAGVTAVDNPGADRVDVTIPGGGGGSVSVTQATATATTTITSTTGIQINSMSIVAPSAGDYLIQFSASGNIEANDHNFFYSIYVNGVEKTASIRKTHEVDASGFSSHVLATGVLAGQVIEVKGKNDQTSVNSYVYQRVLTAMKVA